MEQADIMSRLQEVFDGVLLAPVRLRRELTADEVPEWDSLIHISLVAAAEKEFGVRFRTGEVEGTNDIGEFVDLIARRVGER
jgi:acyl carrier protein